MLLFYETPVLLYNALLLQGGCAVQVRGDPDGACQMIACHNS
jgi:hypothetical protein